MDLRSMIALLCDYCFCSCYDVAYLPMLKWCFTHFVVIGAEYSTNHETVVKIINNNQHNLCKICMWQIILVVIIRHNPFPSFNFLTSFHVFTFLLKFSFLISDPLVYSMFLCFFSNHVLIKKYI